MEVSVPGGGNIYLGIGNWLPISYLEQQDTKDLADLYLCAARRDWSHDGNVSLRAYHDHSQHGGVRAWPNLCERRNEQAGPQKTRSSPVTAHFGASKATIFSKRGSPRSESQRGCRRSSP